MDNAIFSFPKPINEPVKAYAPGSSEKSSLKKALAQLSSEEWDIPLVIGGKEIRTGNTGKVVMPHDHHHVLATYHKAGEKEVQTASGQIEEVLGTRTRVIQRKLKDVDTLSDREARAILPEIGPLTDEENENGL